MSGMVLARLLQATASMLLLCASMLLAPAAHAGNPAVPGWYADPDASVFGKRYWIFPTTSAPYEKQLHFDAFSSTDLVHWTRHANVLTAESVKWAKKAM